MSRAPDQFHHADSQKSLSPRSASSGSPARVCRVRWHMMTEDGTTSLLRVAALSHRVARAVVVGTMTSSSPVLAGAVVPAALAGPGGMTTGTMTNGPFGHAGSPAGGVDGAALGSALGREGE